MHILKYFAETELGGRVQNDKSCLIYSTRKKILPQHSVTLYKGMKEYAKQLYSLN